MHRDRLTRCNFGLHLKLGKMNYGLGNLDPEWAICPTVPKEGKTRQEVGQKIYSCFSSCTLCAGKVTNLQCPPSNPSDAESSQMTKYIYIPSNVWYLSPRRIAPMVTQIVLFLYKEIYYG